MAFYLSEIAWYLLIHLCCMNIFNDFQIKNESICRKAHRHRRRNENIEIKAQ